MKPSTFVLWPAVFFCSILTGPAQPQIAIESVGGGQVQLSWPQTGDDFLIKRSHRLLVPPVWGDVSESVIVTDNVNYVVISVSELTEFFELRSNNPDQVTALGLQSGEVPLGLTPPPNPEDRTLTITITQIPTNGVVRRPNGELVAADATLTLEELLGLTFASGDTDGVSELQFTIDYGDGIVSTVRVSLKVVSSSSGVLILATTPQTGKVLFYSDGETISQAGNLPFEGFETWSWLVRIDAEQVVFSAQNGADSGLYSFDGQNFHFLGPNSASGNVIMKAGDRYYYQATSSPTGHELAWTDFVSGETILDLNAGTESSSPANFVDLGGVFYFTADDGSGVVWWSLGDGEDGPAPAVLPENVGVPLDPSKEAFFYVVKWSNGGTDSGSDLWGFDGEHAMHLTDTNPTGNDDVKNLIPFQGGVIFVANDGSQYHAYYFKPGMSDPIQLNGPLPRYLDPVPVLDDVYYYAQQFPYTPLWAFDGVTSQEFPDQPFTEVRSMYFVGSMTELLVIDSAFNGNWLFDGSTFSQPTLPPELGGGSLATALIGAKEVGGKIYFTLRDHGGAQNIVWDGDDEFTVLSDSYGNNAGSRLSAVLLDLTGQVILHDAWGPTDPESKVYGYVGDQVTALVGSGIDSLGGLRYSTVYQGELLFVGPDPIDGIARLLKFDGVDVSPASAEEAGPHLSEFRTTKITEYKGKLYIYGGGPSNVRATWEFDGTHYIRPPFSALVTHVLGDLLVYSTGNRVWSWDGVSDPVAFELEATNGGELTVVADRSYFKARDVTGPLRYQLWMFDGINEPTKIVVNPAADASPADFIEWKGILYFSATSQFHGKQLFSYDNGAAEGERLKQITTRTDLAPTKFYLYDDVLFFLGQEAKNDWRVWEYDGINPPVSLPNPFPEDVILHPSIDFFSLGDLLVLQHAGSGVCSYDGETVLPLWEGASSNPKQLGDRLFLTLNTTNEDGSYIGLELWVTDGTAPPTLVIDLNTRPVGPNVWTVFENPFTP